MTDNFNREPTDREIEIAMFGDGRAIFNDGGYAVLCGLPAGRLFNTKKDDARRDAEIAEWNSVERDCDGFPVSRSAGCKCSVQQIQRVGCECCDF